MDNQIEIKIDFNPKLFNNVYWHLEKAFIDLAIRYIFLFGGSSASKTFSVVQLTIKEMLCSKDHNSLVLRKYGSDIKDSIYSDFKNVISEWQLNDYFVVQQNYIQCSITGSYIRFRGLDDSEKVKGISNFKKVILEELSQFEHEDFKQIRKRLRGKDGQQIIGIFNPISEEHWIKTQIFDKEQLTKMDSDITGTWINKEGDTLIFKVTYLDNKYIVGPYHKDEHVIADFEKDKVKDFAYYNVYGLGNWGRIRTGGEFWKDFNPNIHVRSNEYVNGKLQLFNPSLPVHMGWDENVHPYLPCTLWQIDYIKNEKGEIIRKISYQFDELCLEDPRNKVKHVCAEFIKRYPPEMVNGLFVYGDRTAMKEDTTKEKGQNFFTEILQNLKDYKPRLKIQSVNPNVVKSAGFINEVYAHNFGSIEILIGSNCKKSLHDYTYSLEDSNGGLVKSIKKNPVTGVSYQEFGHCSDIKRYIHCVAFAMEFDEYKRGGKAVHLSVGRRAPTKNAY